MARELRIFQPRNNHICNSASEPPKALLAGLARSG